MDKTSHLARDTYQDDEECGRKSCDSVVNYSITVDPMSVIKLTVQVQEGDDLQLALPGYYVEAAVYAINNYALYHLQCKE